jgi:hypothetical protein
MRTYSTTGALSSECLNLPDSCNVCMSRMSPVPHPHAPGNMWLARCSYIQKLLPPLQFTDRMNGGRGIDDPCIGTGRFAQEHWVLSHPANRPCDLDSKSKYVWLYDGFPRHGFNSSLAMAPRNELPFYVKEKSAVQQEGRQRNGCPSIWTCTKKIHPPLGGVGIFSQMPIDLEQRQQQLFPQIKIGQQKVVVQYEQDFLFGHPTQQQFPRRSIVLTLNTISIGDLQVNRINSLRSTTKLACRIGRATRTIWLELLTFSLLVFSAFF